MADNSNELSGINRMERDQINALPIIRFPGKIHLIDDDRQCRRMARYLLLHRRLGFDTESRPSFKPGESFPISLVQLASSNEAYLFRLDRLDDPAPLLKILEKKGIKKIGVDTQGDICRLKESHRFHARGFVDLAKIAQKKGIIQSGARNLSARYLGQRISKSCQTSNWARDQLSHKQLLYAATDAWICLQIYPLLMGDLTDYNKID